MAAEYNETHPDLPERPESHGTDGQPLDSGSEGIGTVDRPMSTEMLQFGEGVTIDRQGDTVYIYDPTGEKRYMVEQYPVPTVGMHRKLGLQGRTSGGTWSTLMEGYENKAPDTKEIYDISIVVETIDAKNNGSDNTTPGIRSGYSTHEGSSSRSQFGFGYYGTPEVVAADLRELNAVAQTSSDLPPKIDIPATLQKLVNNFERGVFEPPSFVLPQDEVKSSPRIALPRKVTSFLKVLRKRE